MRFHSRALTGVLFLIAAALPSLAAPEPLPGNRSWNRVENVKQVTGRLIAMHRQRRSEGVTKYLGECYRTHRLASNYTQGLEGCIVQDYVHTQVLALVYSRIAQDAAKAMKIPTVLELIEGASRRFNVVFSQYNIPEPEANALKTVMDKHGVPMFMAAVFPASNRDAPPLTAPAAPSKSP